MKNKLLSIFFVFSSQLAFSFEGFPELENKDLVLRKCIVCHSPELVSQQRMTKEVWDETLSWMEKKHSLVFNTKDERKKILAYLAEAFKPEGLEDLHFIGLRPVNPLPETLGTLVTP